MRVNGPEVAGLALYAAIAAAPLGAQRPTERHTPQVDSIFAAYADGESPGCAVAAVDGGETVLARAYGLASLEHDVPITPRTAFYAASVSKQFTAFAVAILAERGELSLDDDVRKWIPEVPDFGRTITIRHLIHHTSGLRDYFGLLGMTGWPSDGPLTEALFLDLVARQKALNFEPGTRYLYSNTGYVLLAVLVERVTGRPLREFADDAIFEPLGMRDTRFRDDHTALVENRALAYAPQRGGGWRLSVPGFDVVGDGGLYTTVEDLARWARNFDEPAAGGGAVLALALTRGRLAGGDSIPYGFGLTHGTYRGRPVVQHGGAYGGYRTYLLRFPAERFAVATLCNVATANASALSRRVAHVFLADRLGPAEERVAASGPGEEGIRLSVEQLARHEGAYWDARSETLRRVAVRDSALAMAVGGRWIPLVALSADRFRPAAGAGELAFAAGPDGVPRLEGRGGAGETTVYVRMPEPVTTPEALAGLAGEYYSDELDTAWRIEVVDGRLAVRRRALPDQPLEPAFADAFVHPAGVLRFERAAQGRVTGFVVSAGRVTGFRFERRGGR